MARVGFSTNRHTEHFNGPAAFQDPGPSTTWPNIDGGSVLTATTGINLAGSLVAREGYGNASTVLGRQYDVTAAGTTGFDQPLGIMNPRLVRLGVRFPF